MAPLCYIICDPVNRNLSPVLARCEQHLRQHGYAWQRVTQCYGHTVTDETWQSLGIQRLDQGKWVRRPGAWGCFISHYRLWLECRAQGDTRIILEHDALAQAAWPGDLDLDHCVWKLWRPVPLKYKPTVGSWNRGAWAYTVTAAQADSLIRFTEQHGALALDKQLGSHAVTWQHWHTDLFLHDPTPRASTTAR
jgi:hypothetical protein